MAAKISHTATEYVANSITVARGKVSDITSVGVYHNMNPEIVPQLADFTAVTLADGTKNPPDQLAILGQIDVVSLIGPKAGADLSLPVPGEYHRWVLVQTTFEDVIRKVDVLIVW